MADTTTALADELRGLLAPGGLPGEPAELVHLIDDLESAKSVICAVQAAASVALDLTRRREEAGQDVPAARQGRGVAGEIALARKESLHRGRTLLGLAKVLGREMPHTAARLADGTLNEWRATVLVRETACLSIEDRAAVDERLCVDPGSLHGVGTRELTMRAKKLATELDVMAVVKRARRAESERRVSIRPAPDAMTYFTGLLPVGQGVAAYAALRGDAESLRAAGDGRSVGAIMADLLVSRVTGTARKHQPGGGTEESEGADTRPAVPVTVHITLSDAALAGAPDPALIGGRGITPMVVPAEIARRLAAQAIDSDAQAWFRRLYLDPEGHLVAMTGRQRFHTAGLAAFLAQRDLGICRTPYCDAPIRHADHIEPAAVGGETSAANGQGLCEACNHVKQAPGWRQRTVPDDDPARHTVETTTPTGHRYRSRAPAQPDRLAKRPHDWTLTA